MELVCEESRVNVMQAMMATRQSYAAEEAAGRVIPCVAPLAVDAVQEVRQSALATLQAFVTTLQEHSSKLDSASDTPGAAAQQVRRCLSQDGSVALI